MRCRLHSSVGARRCARSPWNSLAGPFATYSELLQCHAPPGNTQLVAAAIRTPQCQPPSTIPLLRGFQWRRPDAQSCVRNCCRAPRTSSVCQLVWLHRDLRRCFVLQCTGRCDFIASQVLDVQNNVCIGLHRGCDCCEVKSPQALLRWVVSDCMCLLFISCQVL
jgi:hypothetical protein